MDWMSVGEVAVELHVSQEMVYKLLRGGVLSGIRIGSSWRIERDFLERWISIRRMDSRKLKLGRAQEEVLHTLHRSLRKEYDRRLVGVYVYGSVARGEATSESDLDLLVVLNPLGDRWQERATINRFAYAAGFGKRETVVISVIVASETELMDRLDPLFCRIREEGRLAA